MKKLVCGLILVFVASGTAFSQCVSDASTSGIMFTNITKRSPKCVFISGNSQFMNNFFIDSCVDDFDLKETRSLGYVHDVFFTSETSGWAILSGVIKKIKDKKLESLASSAIDRAANKSFNKVFFIDKLRGWALGDGGKLAGTIDGGATWKVAYRTDLDLIYIDSADKENFWMIGDKFHVSSDGKTTVENALIRSKDAGVTWNIATGRFGDRFVGLQFLDAGKGVALTEGGRMLRTTDGGNSWEKTAAGHSDLSAVFFLNEHNGWAADRNGVLYFTESEGSTWQKRADLPEIRHQEFTKLIFLDRSNGWIFSTVMVARTRDGGTTWEPINIEEKLTQHAIK